MKALMKVTLALMVVAESGGPPSSFAGPRRVQSSSSGPQRTYQLFQPQTGQSPQTAGQTAQRIQGIPPLWKSAPAAPSAGPLQISPNAKLLLQNAPTKKKGGPAPQISGKTIQTIPPAATQALQGFGPPQKATPPKVGKVSPQVVKDFGKIVNDLGGNGDGKAKFPNIPGQLLPGNGGGGNGNGQPNFPNLPGNLLPGNGGGGGGGGGDDGGNDNEGNAQDNGDHDHPPWWVDYFVGPWIYGPGVYNPGSHHPGHSYPVPGGQTVVIGGLVAGSVDPVAGEPKLPSVKNGSELTVMVEGDGVPSKAVFVVNEKPMLLEVLNSQPGNITVKVPQLLIAEPLPVQMFVGNAEGEVLGVFVFQIVVAVVE